MVTTSACVYRLWQPIQVRTWPHKDLAPSSESLQDLPLQAAPSALGAEAAGAAPPWSQPPQHSRAPARHFCPPLAPSESWRWAGARSASQQTWSGGPTRFTPAWHVRRPAVPHRGSVANLRAHHRSPTSNDKAVWPPAMHGSVRRVSCLCPLHVDKM